MNYETPNIDAFVSSFMKTNNLNVAFVDNITITIGNNGARGQWNAVQQNLQRKYNTTVKIVIDPNIQGRDTGTRGSVSTSSTYGSFSVGVSGVQNGNANYADPGVIRR